MCICTYENTCIHVHEICVLFKYIYIYMYIHIYLNLLKVCLAAWPAGRLGMSAAACRRFRDMATSRGPERKKLKPMKWRSGGA